MIYEIKSQAELKPIKVGEPLPDNADGNPEPSRSNDRACVETRRRVCMRVGCDNPIRYGGAKYCSPRCRNAQNAYNWAVKTGKIVNPGVGSGGNQLAENNPNYKNGIGDYSERGLSHYRRICNRCSSEENLLVHHIDEDRTNNNLSNLEVLCKSCHQKHHLKRDAEGKFTKG